MVPHDTTETQRRALQAKLGAQNMAHAVALGYRRRLLALPEDRVRSSPLFRAG